MIVARVFTRQQFYELVWSKPMTHLAKEFAISDVALHRSAKGMVFLIHHSGGGQKRQPESG